MTIDWYIITEQYNYNHNTEYNSEDELIFDLYEEKKSIGEVASALGISRTCCKKKMNQIGIKINPPGRPHRAAPIRNKIKKYPKNYFKNKTIRQMAKELQCSTRTAYNFHLQLGYKCIKRKYKQRK